MKKLLSIIALCFFITGCKVQIPCADLFEYCNRNIWELSEDGTQFLSPLDSPVLPEKTAVTLDYRINPDGSYTVFDHRQTILTGAPGEQILPVLETDSHYYILSEKDVPFRALYKVDKKTYQPEKISQKKNHEAGGVLYSAGETGTRIHGILYYGLIFEYDFFDPELKKLYEKLKDIYATQNIHIRTADQTGELWLCEILFANKPSINLLCNIKQQNWKELDQPPGFSIAHDQKKEIFTFTASDGFLITGILSYPPKKYGRKNLPLIVFPHGGPFSISMYHFDYRVEYLTRHGFAVLQPNYRGSIGFGKEFRTGFHSPQGIKRSLADIAEATEVLIEKGIANPQKITVSGGSWGGYCALALLAEYPELYKTGISLFGASDLVAMLETFPEKSVANRTLDKIQYGDITNTMNRDQLKALSPFYCINKIKAPILIFHFYNDKVLDYSQSEKFYQKARCIGKDISFIHGPGEHGFKNGTDEAKAYKKIVSFIEEKQ